MQRERQEAEAQQRQARLVLTLSIALGLLLVSIVALMWNRARRERALRRAAETLEAQAHVISTVQEGVLFIDDTDAIVYANESASRLLGRARDALVGLTVGAVGLSPETLRSAGELQLSDATGRNRTVQLTTSTVSIQDRPLRLGVLRDVTEFRRLEREVLALAGRERTLQSAEVHEGIAQDLAGISLLLRGLHGAAPADEAALESIIEHVLEVIARSRALAQSLTPVQMAGGSLATALERLAAEFNDGQGPNVIFLRNGDEPTLGTASAEQLYRIARECLCVVAQQTGCHEITMKLGSSREVLMLAISGDGETPESARNENGLAWATIAHLARLIDGTASTEFLTGHGARTTITVPLQAA
jgi:signal transduction histidine kinase